MYDSNEQSDQIPEARDFLAAAEEEEAQEGATECQWMILDLEKNDAGLTKDEYLARVIDWLRHVHSWWPNETEREEKSVEVVQRWCSNGRLLCWKA